MSPPASEADPFARFGLAKRFSIDETRAKSAYLRLLAAAHPDRASSGVGAASDAARSSAAINDAYRSIATPFARAETLLRMHTVATPPSDALAPSFLVEMMELREALDEAIAGDEAARISDIRHGADECRAARIAALASFLDRAVATPPPLDVPLYAEARRTLNELRYVERVLDRIREWNAKSGTASPERVRTDRSKDS
ncbi:MAG: Fe-S protein assembly co-chaperone HscB [Phycisphaerae bacterium]|nr:Fe-S protein assembly co-chaperone HscB [Phycisphaerae bacterium]